MQTASLMAGGKIECAFEKAYCMSNLPILKLCTSRGAVGSLPAPYPMQICRLSSHWNAPRHQVHAARLPHTVDEQVGHAILGLFLDQPVDIGFEAGEPVIEAARELQVLDDGAVEAFTRDQ